MTQDVYQQSLNTFKSINKNDSYDNSFNLFKQAVAERRANNIVAKMMERNSSQAFLLIYQLKIIQILLDSNHLKNLVAKRRASQKKKNNAKARANAQAKVRAHENAIYKKIKTNNNAW